MKVEISHRIEFGKHRFYPVNKVARNLLLMMKQNSFTKEQLTLLDEASEQIEIVTSVEGWK